MSLTVEINNRPVNVTVVDDPKYITQVVGGPPGLSADVADDLIGLTWGTPGAEVANAIEVTGTLTDFLGAAFSNSLTDIEVLVSDGATDAEPSATATLSAAGTPVGTVLAGSGTARMVMRSASGSIKVKVTETAAANRYLWIKQGGNARLWVRSLLGVHELVFT